MAIDINTFKANPVQQPVVTKPTETNSKSDSKMSTTTKVVIGTGLAALAAVGIYVATKGKGAKSVAGGQKIETTVQENINNAQEAIKHSIDEFKSLGHFEKGKAVLNNGENFTGQLAHESKDGSKLLMDYKDGLLQTTTANTDKGVIKKEFSYDSGKLSSIVKNGEKVFEKKLFQNGDSLVKTSKSIVYSSVGENGKLKAIEVQPLNYDGTFCTLVCEKNKVFIFKNDGKTVDYILNGKDLEDIKQYRTKNQYLSVHSEGGNIYKFVVADDKTKTWISGKVDGCRWVQHEAFGTYTEHCRNDLDGKLNRFLEPSAPELVQIGDSNFYGPLRIIRTKDLNKDGTRSATKGIKYRKYNTSIEPGQKVIEIKKGLAKDSPLVGRYNIETKEFSDLNGISLEDANKEMSEYLDMVKNFKKDTLDVYKLVRKRRVDLKDLKSAKASNGVDISKMYKVY